MDRLSDDLLSHMLSLAYHNQTVHLDGTRIAYSQPCLLVNKRLSRLAGALPIRLLKVFLSRNSIERKGTLLRSIHCPVQELHIEDGPGSYKLAFRWPPLLHFVTHCPHPDQVLRMLLQLLRLQLNVDTFVFRLPSVPLVFLVLCIPLLLYVTNII